MGSAGPAPLRGGGTGEANDAPVWARVLVGEGIRPDDQLARRRRVDAAPAPGVGVGRDAEQWPGLGQVNLPALPVSEGGGFSPDVAEPALAEPSVRCAAPEPAHSVPAPLPELPPTRGRHPGRLPRAAA
eukprot:CAMPEP_0172622168 /NCGR_PEP_ID=MMETSP1068-20121228/118508_1 /TAXON_ID=35684 /ORGANISM="Pseudopedinella elastica, Strain CCMP716" /LENGTH=128 /DNA_ID=CAMNT_0013430245 /DNA_START=456 /DNA_END=838 /DNA_ORIENTATION=+